MQAAPPPWPQYKAWAGGRLRVQRSVESDPAPRWMRNEVRFIHSCFASIRGLASRPALPS